MKKLVLVMPIFWLFPVACQKREMGKEIRQANPSNQLVLVYSGDVLGGDIFPDRIFLEDKDQNQTSFAPSDPESVEQSSFMTTPAWSPDGSWLVLPNGRFNGFRVFRSDSLPDDLGKKNAGRLVGVLDPNGTSWWHEFVEWKSPTSFLFRAGLSGDLMLFECDLKSNEIRAIDEDQLKFTQISN